MRKLKLTTLDDKDPDGVLGLPLKETLNGFEVVLQPQIPLTQDNAWLKYRFAAGLCFLRQAPLFRLLGLNWTVPFKLIFGDYHHHNPTENNESLPPSVICKDCDSLLIQMTSSLAEKEALSYQVRGELSASVTLSWSDVFTSNLSTLTKLLKSGKMLAIAGRRCQCEILRLGVIDDFRLSFPRVITVAPG